MQKTISIPHKLPKDLKESLQVSILVWKIWKDITPLARNEWICWVISVKKKETREKHVQRVVEDLSKGKKRPCCWSGCPHR